MEGEDDVFEIESILESSVKKGIHYYRVRWKGFSENDDTWEPEENLFGCKDVLDQYWKKSKKPNQTKEKVKKRKSESTSQTQSTKAKKKKSGRTTNNSTIARIDSSSSQEEKIVLPEANNKGSSVKHSKTKRKHDTDDEVRLKKDRLDTSQENKSSNKSKKTNVKKRKQKKVVNKDSSLKSELEQPCKVKQTLDENENTKDFEQILPEQTTSLITIVDEADNSTAGKVKSATLQRENSRESSGSRSVGKRRSWSSYEASPEFVPEYCDETLTYHMGSEEEFEYFEDTAFFVKESVGFEESNCFEPTEELPTDEPFVENDNLVEDDDVKDNDNQVKDGEGHAEDDEVHVKRDEDHVKDCEGHAKGDEGHAKVGEGHAEDNEVHVKRDEDHVKDGEGHAKGGEGHAKVGGGHAKGDDVCVKDNDKQVKDDEGHAENDEVPVKGDEDHVKGGEGHAKVGEGHAKGVDVCVKDDKEDVKRDEDNVKNNKDHVKDNENLVKDDEEHVKNDENLVKNDEELVKNNENQVKDDEERVKNEESQIKDDEEHVKESKDKINTILPVKDVRAEGQNQVVSSLPGHEFSDPTSKDDSISDHNIQQPEKEGSLKNDVLMGEEEGLKCANNNTDLLSSDQDTAPKLSKEESDSKTVGSNDKKLSEGLSNAGEEVAMVGHVKTEKTSDLKLEMTLSSSGDNAGFTDSECMSPEFVRLPEPQKDYFDKVFAERMGEENTTHSLTCEKENKESKFIDCKDEPNNTTTHGNDSCDDTKKEANSGMELHESTSTVVLSNSNGTLAEQSGSNISNDEKLHRETKLEKQLQVLEHKTPKCDKTKSLEGNKCDEKNCTQSKTETVSSMDDLKEETCPNAGLSPIDKQRKLSEEETAHCLLDLSSVRISGSKVTKIHFRSSNQETSSSVVDMDFNKSDKLESRKEIIDAKKPHSNLGKNKNADKSKPHPPFKKKSEGNNSKGKKLELLLNLPFIDQGNKEVLGILDNAMKPTQDGERDSKEKCMSSTHKTIALTTVQEEATTSKSTKESRSEMKHMSTSLLSSQEMSGNKKSNKSAQTAAKSLKISTDKSRTSSIRPNECQRKQTITSDLSLNTASMSSVKQNLPLSESKPNLPHPEIGQREVSGLPLSRDTSEKKPEVIVLEKNENKYENKQNTDTHTVSGMEKNKSGASKQGLTKEVLTPVNDKDSLPRHSPTAEGSSTSVLMKQNLDSHGKTITQVYGRGRYEGPSQGNETWSSDTMKVHSAQFNPTSLSYINPILYSDSPGGDPFFVSHLNQKGFSVLPGSFASHFNQQPVPAQANIHAHQKPFSAVAGFNWYPENRPRQMGFATHRAIAPKPFYYVPAFPASSPYSRQVTPDNLYARALQEMANKRRPESSTQPAPSSFTANEYFPPIDADKAWYVKHVGNINTETSLNNLKSSQMVEEDIKKPTRERQAEITTTITSDASNTIKANKDDFSSLVAVTHSPKEKAGANSTTAETKKQDSCLADMNKNFTGDGFECFENKCSSTSSFSKSQTSSSPANSGLAASQEMTEVSSTTIAIAESEGKAIVKEREKGKNKDIEKGKSKDKSATKSNQKSMSHSKPDSKELSLKDVKNTKQRKTGSEKLENRSSGNRSKITSKERGRDSSIDLKKEKKSDFEKSCEKDTEISQKREDSLKTDFRSEKDDRRSRRDSKGKELKREASVDSEVEFDLDDYSPGEIIIEKVEKMAVSHTGIPSAMSLREVKTAIKRGDSATVLASLAGGMNIDSQDAVSGMTLLMRAVSFGQENIVRLLLNHGANINIKDSTGSTPLIAACEQGFENIVALLLNAEIDINAKQTLSGETALIKACVNGYYSIVAMLLAQGADCQMRSVSGLTAAQLAAQSGHFEIRDLLESHGKKLQRCVETAIASCLCDSSRLMYPPLLPFVSLYPAEGQKFTYHFHCSKLLLSKTVLLFCLRAVFSRSGQVDLSFSKDNGVHTVLLNGSLQSPVLSNNKSVFVLQPKLDTNRLNLQTYQSHVHLLVCIYAAELDEGILNIDPSTMAV